MSVSSPSSNSTSVHRPISTRHGESNCESGSDVRREPLLVLGAGPAGLITAYTFLQDGFSNITIITGDQSVGGVWSRGKVYTGMKINNVHGQFSFSSLQMPPPSNAAETGGRLSGGDMCNYFETFYRKFIEGKQEAKTLFGKRVSNIRRGRGPQEGWDISVVPVDRSSASANEEKLWFKRVVLCSGGCSTPSTPLALSASAARYVGFKGLVVHSAEWWANVGKLVTWGSQSTIGKDGIVIVGGGKSAQDIASYFAIHHPQIRVTVVYGKLDSFIAVERPMNPRIRQSRLISILSPSKDMKTWTERFLHKTRLGAWIVRAFWQGVHNRALKAYAIPGDHPLSLTRSIFWENKTNDEGVRRSDAFHKMAMDGRIGIRGGVRVLGWRNDCPKSNDGTWVDSSNDAMAGPYLLLNSGEKLYPSAVVLCTGYTSSWNAIFAEEEQKEIGLVQDITEDELKKYTQEWDGYETLRRGPAESCPDVSPSLTPVSSSSSVSSMASSSGSSATLVEDYATVPTTQNELFQRKSRLFKDVPSLYNGIIPANSLKKRDIAVNGAIVSANAGYAFELSAQYISSYFLSEPMRLPPSVKQAREETVRGFAWLYTRFPSCFSLQARGWRNASYAGSVPHFTWPQAMDSMLEDMYLPAWRSARGGWWDWIWGWTWLAFLKPVMVEELNGLSAERKARLDVEGQGAKPETDSCQVDSR